jgi:MFS family permease
MRGCKLALYTDASTPRHRSVSQSSVKTGIIPLFRQTIDPSIRSALIGVAGMFFSHGVMIAVRAATIPVIKTQLAASDAELAFCLTAMGLGALVAFAFASALVHRLGSAKATLLSIIAAALLFSVQAFIFNLWIMAFMLFLLGAAVGMSDIAMNVQASVAEQRAGTSYMTRIHGCWSVGAITGSLGAGFLIERMSPAAFTITFSVISVLLAWLAVKPFLQEDRSKAAPGQMFAFPASALWPFCVMSFLALMTVVGIRDWAPIYLKENLGSSLSLSVQTFAAFQVTTAMGRFSGDYIRQRFGDTLLLVAGGVLGCVSLIAGLASQNATGMFVALAVLGLAHANIIPALISIAGKHDPGNESRNVSAVMGLGYGGFILGPVIIGALAQAQGLAAGLASVAVASLLITAAAVASRQGAQKS